MRERLDGEESVARWDEAVGEPAPEEEGPVSRHEERTNKRKRGRDDAEKETQQRKEKDQRVADKAEKAARKQREKEEQARARQQREREEQRWKDRRERRKEMVRRDVDGRKKQGKKPRNDQFHFCECAGGGPTKETVAAAVQCSHCTAWWHQECASVADESELAGHWHCPICRRVASLG